MIIVIEDMPSHYEALLPLLRRTCQALHMEHEIKRVQSEEDVENELALCESSGEPAVIIADILMELPGGLQKLDAYIRRLWREPANSWRGHVPIIIWSAHSENFRDLPERARSSRIHKLPSVGLDRLQELRAALRKALGPLPA